MLSEVPNGTGGRPSKSLTLEQAKALLEVAERSPMRAYTVVSLLTSARTEELRALAWNHLDLDDRPKADPPVPPSIAKDAGWSRPTGRRASCDTASCRCSQAAECRSKTSHDWWAT